MLAILENIVHCDSYSEGMSQDRDDCGYVYTIYQRLYKTFYENVIRSHAFSYVMSWYFLNHVRRE